MRRIHRDSVEYADPTVTATVTLDSQPVDIAILPTTVTDPDSGDWQAAVWLGAPGTTRIAGLLIGPGTTYGAIAPAIYAVWVRVTDNPEIPVIRVGQIEIT